MYQTDFDKIFKFGPIMTDNGEISKKDFLNSELESFSYQVLSFEKDLVSEKFRVIVSKNEEPKIIKTFDIYSDNHIKNNFHVLNSFGQQMLNNFEESYD